MWEKKNSPDVRYPPKDYLYPYDRTNASYVYCDMELVLEDGDYSEASEDGVYCDW